MGSKQGLVFIVTLLLTFGGAGGLSAAQQNPGSCLLFPYYDCAGSSISIHSIMNVGEKSEWLRLVFVDGIKCKPMDFFFELTPGDTFTFAAHGINPFQETGFIYAYVTKSPYSVLEKKADCLVGQEIVVGSWDERPINFSINAVSFQAIDLIQDGKLHLNGKEYTCAPKAQYFPRFFGQDTFLYSKLILINLTGGQYFNAEVDFLIYNDNEKVFSATELIDCFDVVKLEDVSLATSKTWLLSTNHSVMEPWPFHALAETGALMIRGDYAVNHTGSVVIPDASLYSVLIEGFAGPGYAAADLPFQIEDPTLFNHAMLWSTDPSGN